MNIPGFDFNSHIKLSPSALATIGSDTYDFTPPNETWVPVKSAEYPYIAFIQNFKMEHIALGCIVTPDKVVSICSAVTKFYEDHPESKVKKDIRIYAGSLNMYPSQYFAQVRLVVKEKYKKTCDENVAVFYTSKPFVFNHWVQPMPSAYVLNGPGYFTEEQRELRWNNYRIHDGFERLSENWTICTFVGFGATSNSPIPNPKVEYSEKLKRVEMNIMSSVECLQNYKYRFRVEDKYRYPDITDYRGQTCAANFRLVCAPDIGGPIICQGKVYAMLARTRDCGKYGEYPFVYDMHYFILEWGYVYGVEYTEEKPRHGSDPKKWKRAAYSANAKSGAPKKR